MKKNSLFAFVAISAIALLSGCAGEEKKATNENPSGLYRLEKVGYENGKADKVPTIEQYKYCTNDITFSLNVYSTRGGTSSILMENKDHKTFNYTGLVQDSKETQIFDSNSDGFTMRWYNANPNGSNTFPGESYIREYYTTNYMSYGVVNFVDMIKQQYDTNYNKFMGVWKCIAQDGRKIMYKIYSPDYVMLIQTISDEAGKEVLAGKVVDIDYVAEDGSKIIEHFGGNGNECDITWIDADNFELIWMSYGTPESELWFRCGLPQCFQTAFGTNLPIK